MEEDKSLLMKEIMVMTTRAYKEEGYEMDDSDVIADIERDALVIRNSIKDKLIESNKIDSNGKIKDREVVTSEIDVELLGLGI